MGQIESSDTSLRVISKFLGVESDSLAKWICSTQLKTGAENITTHLTLDSSINTRDALARSLYAKLFEWLVGAINHHLDDEYYSKAFIGILDIYGFETFDSNGFEQFCINYANEKLQYMFTRHSCQLEQEQYISEGLPWHSIPYNDNKPCLDLLEGSMGVFSLLNEECTISNRNDHTFLRKMGQYLASSANFKTEKVLDNTFTICHYGNDVKYCADGFVEKNRNKLEVNLESLLHKSSNSFIKELYHENPQVAASKKKGGVSATVGSEFKVSKST